MTHPTAPDPHHGTGGTPIERHPIMDPDVIAFQAAKQVAARFTNALNATHSTADVRVARSAEFHGVWGVELHATRRDDTIDSLMLMNDARYVTVNGDYLETRGCVAILAKDGAISNIPCIISYPLINTEDHK